MAFPVRIKGAKLERGVCSLQSASVGTLTPQQAPQPVFPPCVSTLSTHPCFKGSCVIWGWTGSPLQWTVGPAPTQESGALSGSQTCSTLGFTPKGAMDQDCPPVAEFKTPYVPPSTPRASLRQGFPPALPTFTPFALPFFPGTVLGHLL